MERYKLILEGYREMLIKQHEQMINTIKDIINTENVSGYNVMGDIIRRMMVNAASLRTSIKLIDRRIERLVGQLDCMGKA